jgi:hypothetical protein
MLNTNVVIAKGRRSREEDDEKKEDNESEKNVMAGASPLINASRVVVLPCYYYDY